MVEKTAQVKESELFDIIDKSRALDATYKLLDISLGTLDIDLLTKNIVEIIPKAMGYELGVLLVADQITGKLTKVGVSSTYLENPIMSCLNTPEKEISIVLGYEDNYSVVALETGKQIESTRLYDYLRPALTFEECEMIQKLLSINSIIATPLTTQERGVGILLVGTAKTPERITTFEKTMLSKFSKNSGIAIENAKLYSNLKSTKEDLHKAYENLKVLNKLKDEFLSVASHELRTPMTIVKSYLWMLEKQKAGRLNKKQNEYLSKALQGTQRMIALINDMLDISRFEQKKVVFDFKQVNICTAIADLLSSFEITTKEKNIYLKFEGDCQNIFVDADEIKLRDVLTNLVGNAVKFTKVGGITVGVDDEDTFIKVWIRDTGSGVDPSDLDKLFHKFARIDNSYTIATDAGGTGLGLYIVKLYIEGMGGRVGAWSEGSNKGSTFWFTLPKNKIQKYGESFSKQIDIPIQDTLPV